MPERTALDPILLDLLACPQDKGPLLLVTDESGADVLYNPRLRRSYPIENGIPVLLVDDARDVSEAEHEKLIAQHN
ncbi:MAG TPA: Trm112 family protein [Nocardia sp.]|uniref:Trm112 family protein n=1 Tax=Nocardia TaxID=1817 RepID=UPI00245562AF|nr:MULTISPECIES: Trm112 family protein [Nocardia]HLS78500.1 Trm112 family protein [Nocardia sp.]